MLPFFGIEFPRHRIKIGVPHLDLYSSCKRTYNPFVKDQVTPKKDFLTCGVKRAVHGSRVPEFKSSRLSKDKEDRFIVQAIVFTSIMSGDV
jgi:hypothetical protein